jgi:hypothetical protein
MIVAVEVGVENRLRLLDGLEPDAVALDAEALVEQRAVPSFDDGVRLQLFTRVVSGAMPSSCRNSSYGWRSGRPRNSQP